jgi:hypothetical protein
MLIDAVRMAAGPNARADQVPIQNMHSKSLLVETPQREICYLDSKAITCLFRAPRGTTCKRMLATARGVRMC